MRKIFKAALLVVLENRVVLIGNVLVMLSVPEVLKVSEAVKLWMVVSLVVGLFLFLLSFLMMVMGDETTEKECIIRLAVGSLLPALISAGLAIWMNPWWWAAACIQAAPVIFAIIVYLIVWGDSWFDYLKDWCQK